MKLRYAAAAAILTVGTCGISLAAEPELGADNTKEAKMVKDGSAPAQRTQQAQPQASANASQAQQTGGTNSK